MDQPVEEMIADYRAWYRDQVAELNAAITKLQQQKHIESMKKGRDHDLIKALDKSVVAMLVLKCNHERELHEWEKVRV
jgi:hypothetical protein